MFRRTTVEELQSFFNYDAKTGQVTWKIDWHSCRKGTVVGSQSKNGQRFVRLRGECIMSSHLAIALSSGEFPTGQVVHINGVQDDDRLANLKVLGQGVLDEDLKTILNYERETGVFYWKINYGKKIKAGTTAGYKDKNNGYVTIRIGYQLVMAHRLAWFMETGNWPEALIDHINGDRSDNKFRNLRQVTPIENNQNAGIRVDNNSGRKGVSYCGRTKSWEAYINFEGIRYHRSCKTFEQADFWRTKMENLLHEFASSDPKRVSFNLQKMQESAEEVKELTPEDI